MKKIISAIGALALVAGFATSSRAAISVTDIYVGGPSGSIATCTSGSINAYSDSTHTTAITSITGATGTATLHNDCSTEAVYLTWPNSSTASVPGTSFMSGAHSTSSLGFFYAGDLVLYKCATSANPGSAGECPTSGTRTLEKTITLSITGSGGGGGRPSASATPTPTPTSTADAAAAVASATTATAEALAALPKSTTQPKIYFGSGTNGLDSTAKKALAKLADVAVDGYAVRITGVAGIQTGVDNDIVRALARKRANTIRTYLVKEGVDVDNIIIKTKLASEGSKPTTRVTLEPLS